VITKHEKRRKNRKQTVKFHYFCTDAGDACICSFQKRNTSLSRLGKKHKSRKTLPNVTRIAIMYSIREVENRGAKNHTLGVSPTTKPSRGGLTNHLQGCFRGLASRNRACPSMVHYIAGFMSVVRGVFSRGGLASHPKQLLQLAVLMSYVQYKRSSHLRGVWQPPKKVILRKHAN